MAARPHSYDPGDNDANIRIGKISLPQPWQNDTFRFNSVEACNEQ